MAGSLTALSAHRFGRAKEELQTAELLLNLLEHCEDEEFWDYVTTAVWNNDTLALYDLEETLEKR